MAVLSQCKLAKPPNPLNYYIVGPLKQDYVIGLMSNLRFSVSKKLGHLPSRKATETLPLI